MGYITKDSTVTIDIIAANLRNTIAGKEELLKHVRDKMLYEDATGYLMAIKVLEINIAELRRILQDVEQCQAEAE